MTKAQGTRPGHENSALPYWCLPASWSIGIIVTCCSIAFGLQANPIHVLPGATEPHFWSQTWDGWLERGTIFVFTLVLMLKQTDYYYGWLNWSVKSGLFKAIGCANTWEVVSDFALGIWGASLFAISALWPYLWLPAFAIYCVLGWVRCRLSLARGKVSKQHKYRNDRFIITSIFSLAPFDWDFDKLGKSIEGMHKASGRKEISKKAVLTGWIWSFSVYSFISVISSSCLLLYNVMSVRVISLISAMLSVGILLCHSGPTSNISQRWGENHYAQYSE